jgi:hypothetical protein
MLWSLGVLVVTRMIQILCVARLYGRAMQREGDGDLFGEPRTFPAVKRVPVMVCTRSRDATTREYVRRDERDLGGVVEGEQDWVNSNSFPLIRSLASSPTPCYWSASPVISSFLVPNPLAYDLRYPKLPCTNAPYGDHEYALHRHCQTNPVPRRRHVLHY